MLNCCTMSAEPMERWMKATARSITAALLLTLALGSATARAKESALTPQQIVQRATAQQAFRAKGMEMRLTMVLRTKTFGSSSSITS